MEMQLEFRWDDDSSGIGNYECQLFENGECIDDITFTDYTHEWRHSNDMKCRYARPYSFEVSWCHGWSMSQGFDYDPDYYDHADEKGLRLGGYQGKCTHTVEDIKKWCEEWLAQQYIRGYQETIKGLERKKARYDWFKENGYGDMDLEVQ